MPISATSACNGLLTKRRASSACGGVTLMKLLIQPETKLPLLASLIWLRGMIQNDLQRAQSTAIRSIFPQSKLLLRLPHERVEHMARKEQLHSPCIMALSSHDGSRLGSLYSVLMRPMRAILTGGRCASSIDLYPVRRTRRCIPR